MPTGICRYCGQLQPLVKAHIIPEAFFRAIGTGREAPLLITNVASRPHARRAPIGVYDNQILCDTCERRFDKVDAYGTKTLLHTLRGDALVPFRRGRDVVGFWTTGIDQQLLKRFFVATLWRASVSTHPFFERVRLGPKFEDLAKNSVTEGEMPPVFGALISCWIGPDGRDEHVGFMNPFAERYDDIRGYRFYFGRFTAYVKVDQRPFRRPLGTMSLGTQAELFIVRRDHRASKDFAAMINTAIVQHENSQRAKRGVL
jgi:hypothetical protein